MLNIGVLGKAKYSLFFWSSVLETSKSDAVLNKAFPFAQCLMFAHFPKCNRNAINLNFCFLAEKFFWTSQETISSDV